MTRTDAVSSELAQARDRLLGRVTVSERGCWLWTGAVHGNGYGAFRLNGKQIGAHRAAYTILVGPIPNDKELDHLCRTPTCINPAHLEAVSHQTNVHRGTNPSAINAARDSCIHGHPFDESNTMHRPNGKRTCRTCHRRNWAIQNHKRGMKIAKDPVTPEIYEAVIQRDGGCVAPMLGATTPCRGPWGNSAIDARGRYIRKALTLDHVKDTPRMGKRAPSDLGHLVTICWHHHLDGWATANRPLLRDYIARANEVVTSST